MPIQKALIIDTPHIDRILRGEKTWEMRSTKTQQRGRVALIRKGSGQVIGTVSIVGCRGPLSRDEMLAAHAKHRIDSARIESGAVDKWKYAWEVADPVLLPQPVPYVHPAGAVIWVNLDETVCAAVEREGC